MIQKTLKKKSELSFGEMSKVRRARRALDRACIVLAVSPITETSSQFYLCHPNNSFRLLLDDYGRLS